MGGGLLWEEANLAAVLKVADELELATHLDGARLWNASVATGLSERELAFGFDTVSVCLSKGLGAPIGSLICGSQKLIHRAHRVRKMLGGGMRQAGILAAAGIYAIENNRARLEEDHENTAYLARELSALPGLGIDVDRTQTNILMIDLDPNVMSGRELVGRAAERGVRFIALSESRLRLVTHLDVDRAQCTRAIEIFSELLG